MDQLNHLSLLHDLILELKDRGISQDFEDKQHRNGLVELNQVQKYIRVFELFE